MIWQTVSTSSENTEQVAETIGHNLRGGEVFELISDLGGGKTTFVRGLVKGAGSTDKVASPSFTISREYSLKAEPFSKIVHFDFYRLAEAGIMLDEIKELVDDPEVVVVIEWADIIEKVLPVDTIRMAIKVIGENSRSLSFRIPAKYKYLLENNT